MSGRDDAPPNPARLAGAAAIGLAAGRIAIGAGIWLAPEPSWRALGFGSRPTGPALALGRLAATRDLVLGAWQLAVLGDREQLRAVVAACALVDGGDALAFALALRGGEAMREAGIRGLAAAIPASLAGAWLAARLGTGREAVEA